MIDVKTESVPMWNNDEISTRNCANGKVKGNKVNCSKKLDSWWLPQILASKMIRKECRDCPYMDCEWK